jgi:hypothetical protein
VFASGPTRRWSSTWIAFRRHLEGYLLVLILMVILLIVRVPGREVGA